MVAPSVSIGLQGVIPQRWETAPIADQRTPPPFTLLSLVVVLSDRGPGWRWRPGDAPG